MAKPDRDLINAVLLEPQTLARQIEGINDRIDDMRIGEQALIGAKLVEGLDRSTVARQAIAELLIVRRLLAQVQEHLASIDRLERFVGGEITSLHEPPSGEQP